MADNSGIDWTDATWNPITGCSIKSPGCTNCYAMKLAGTRLRHHPSRAGLTYPTKNGPVWTGEVRLNEQWLDQPFRWKRPRDIFVCAHSDLFHEGVPSAWLDRIFDEMDRAPWHRYQILTKRPDRMAMWCAAPRPNVWLGASAERQKEADERREPLAALAAAGWNTWVSYEPALGLVDWTGYEFIKWLVSGGENGPRPSHPDWHRAARDFCAEHDIPYYFKQWGSWAPAPWKLARDNNETDDAYKARSEATAATHGVNDSGHCCKFDHQPWSCERADQPSRGWAGMRKVRKNAAGHRLDGREWRETPSAA